MTGIAMTKAVATQTNSSVFTRWKLLPRQLVLCVALPVELYPHGKKKMTLKKKENCMKKQHGLRS